MEMKSSSDINGLNPLYYILLNVSSKNNEISLKIIKMMLDITDMSNVILAVCDKKKD